MFNPTEEERSSIISIVEPTYMPHTFEYVFVDISGFEEQKRETMDRMTRQGNPPSGILLVFWQGQQLVSDKGYI